MVCESCRGDLCNECRPRKHVPVVAVAAYYWGAGEDMQAALAALREAGWSGRASARNRVMIADFPDYCEDAHVDGRGALCWFNRLDAPADARPAKFWLSGDGKLSPISR